MTPKEVLTKDFLVKKLIQENLPIMQLALETKITKHTIIKYCKKYNIYSNVKENRSIANGITKNLINQKFGELLVISQGPNDRHNKTRWNCLCSCERTKLIHSSSLLRNLSKTCGHCDRANFKGFKDISGSWWRKTIESSQARGYCFEITIEDVWNQYEKQQKLCALTKIPVTFMKNQDKGSLQTASLDRIDNVRGYTIDNIQIVHKEINRLKNVLQMNELLNWVDLMYKVNHETSKKNSA